jgi:hypothetical protein
VGIFTYFQITMAFFFSCPAVHIFNLSVFIMSPLEGQNPSCFRHNRSPNSSQRPGSENNLHPQER